MNPMDTFFIEWNPEWAAHYRESFEHAEGVISWDGALLDGWVPL